VEDQIEAALEGAKALILDVADFDGNWDEFLADPVFCVLDAEGYPISITVPNYVYTSNTWIPFIDAFLKLNDLYNSYEWKTLNEVNIALSNYLAVYDALELRVSDADLLQSLAPGIFKNGLRPDQLILSANNRATLTLVVEGREFILATNVNNRNVEGQIILPDGSGTLIFDIKGNGSNIKVWTIIPAEVPVTEIPVEEPPIIEESVDYDPEDE